MTSSTFASSATPRRSALRTSPSVMRPSRRRSRSTTSATCRPLRVIASRAVRRVAPSGTSTSASRAIALLTLLDQPGIERHLAEHLHDARGRVSVAIRVREALEPSPDAGREHGLDAAEDLVALRTDVDHVGPAEATSLATADVTDGQRERGRLDEAARRVPDHR